ncbi:winged helix-turn-helix domain-containing protein [Agrococcus terreus]
MGSDTRDGQVSGDYGDVGGARSDVMMLLHVAEDRESATLVSIPRDTMVAAPECTAEDGRTVAARQAVQINGLLDQGPFCALDAVAELALATVAGALIVRARSAVLDGRVLPISPSGLALLRLLAQAQGSVVSREEVLPLLGTADAHAVEVAIGRLREAAGRRDLVRTVVKRGYRLALAGE